MDAIHRVCCSQCKRINQAHQGTGGVRLLWLADHLQYAPFLFPSIGGEENELILHFNSDGLTASFGDPNQTASDGDPDSS